MRVMVYKHDPAGGEPAAYVSHEVPAAPDWTVMRVLDYIADHYDRDLAYFRHSACDHGICGRCLLKADDQPVLACTHTVGERRELRLAPKNGEPVRDLVAR